MIDPLPHRLRRALRLPIPVMLLATGVGLGAEMVTPTSTSAQVGIAVGDPAPAVILETLAGDSVDLGDVIGERPVLIEFWATWCAVCRALEPAIHAAHETYGDQAEFVVVAAAVAQTRERVRAHLERHPLPGRMLWDTRGRFTRAYDAPGTGWIVILDAEGNVAYTGVGPAQDLETELGAVMKAAAP